MAEKPAVGAKDLARQLRRELLEKPRGEFFGAEDDILTRLAVSRPTLRQAARILENEQLLVVKRGPKGGYFVARPDPDTVIRAAGLYLQDRGARLRDLMEAAAGSLSTMVNLAANSRDDLARDNLRQELRGYASQNFGALPFKDFLAAETRMVAAISQLAGNEPLDLVIRILFGCGLGATSDRIFDGFPDRVRDCADLRIKEVEAIVAGDAKLADLFGQKARTLRAQYLAETGDDLL